MIRKEEFSYIEMDNNIPYSIYCKNIYFLRIPVKKKILKSDNIFRLKDHYSFDIVTTKEKEKEKITVIQGFAANKQKQSKKKKVE